MFKIPKHLIDHLLYYVLKHIVRIFGPKDLIYYRIRIKGVPSIDLAATLTVSDGIFKWDDQLLTVLIRLL